MTKRAFFTLLVVVAALTAGSVASRATEAAWARLNQGGYTILLSHTQATSRGDPPNFTLDDCATQSQLTSNGRTQARRQGTRFAARAVSITTVYTSEYCRATNTAELAFGSQTIEPAPELNRLGHDGADADAQLQGMLERINGFFGPGNQIFITHPENIEALTGADIRPGEAIIVTGDEDTPATPDIVGRILLN